jgi:hypothetical protein
MQAAADPLRFPEHFPPTSRWGKFFIGVRWLGPDLSFFQALKKQQAARSPELMTQWGAGLRQEIATRMADSWKISLRWKTAVFLPEDSFRVICHGPSFDWGDDAALEIAVEDLQSHFGVQIPVSFWYEYELATFGEVVDALVPRIAKQANSDVVPSA